MPNFLKKSLQWAQTFKTFIYLNPNEIPYPHEPFLHVLAVGEQRKICSNNDAKLEEKTSFDKLYNFWNKKKSYLFGYFNYDLKNELEDLSSNNSDNLGFPEFYFFEPQYILFFDVKGNFLSDKTKKENDFDFFDKIISEIEKTEVESNKSIYNFQPLPLSPSPQPFSVSPPMTNKPKINARFTEEEYLKTVEIIQNHIIEGDVYELNLCIEFFIEKLELNPLEAYQELCKISKMPFSSFLKITVNTSEKYAICASPERFLKKIGNKLISQPIKGTVKRGQTEAEDKENKHYLRTSEKEQAENMMIVDLVRNDLARTAEIGSTHVSEMFGIYTFQQVHQMISTVEATLHKDKNWSEAIKNAFPMGSMTGAPKIKATELIEKYEKTKRGLYSGSIGYISPNADFDFNVVIRTLFYDALSKYASFQVGGAITYDSDPQSEWEECLLKAKAIRSLFE
ncbi:anthranilate/para-aminobenzoate synthase component I [Bernardetia litoralis DSM 6794]|uniref:Anthranilate/para-aminobenzoate synthase component I n=1 Tax=Bernardetia litoralis (strain ATCC 23117 / DSM 6794 / NBRC 15988 / NCIMB 1366 / Fx l1 / Sio-4) TaxID=880071 RepID=I4AIJ3_BERLS|nr:anthranilate synthase component I family protein [Bernardetia litoralis]AFM03778.1 anthranilate/para-aminobenzoate synthase component I [Bernardetia litoralis DSM 6794]